MNKPEMHRRAAASFLLITSLLLLSACRSTEKIGPTPLASVMISGNTPGQIRDATTDVFHANGFKASDSGSGPMLFEKQGGSISNFAYGSWWADDPVWIRVKASVVPAGEMNYRLQCFAFVVRDKNGSTEEELQLTQLHHHSYQKLLDEVARRFAHK
jgi:hypothetical protein